MPFRRYALPSLSRWRRLDGWLHDTLLPSFHEHAPAPHDARLREQRQMLRSDVAGWFGVQVPVCSPVSLVQLSAMFNP